MPEAAGDTTSPTLTNIGRVQDALGKALRTRVATGKISVDVGFPTGGPTDRAIWISGGVPEWEQAWATSGQAGPGPIDETFTLSVFIHIRREGLAGDEERQYQATRDEALELLLEVQGALRDDHTLEALGPSGLALITGGEWQEGADEASRTVLLEVHIRCDAHLTE